MSRYREYGVLHKKEPVCPEFHEMVVNERDRLQAQRDALLAAAKDFLEEHSDCNLPISLEAQQAAADLEGEGFNPEEFTCEHALRKAIAAAESNQVVSAT